MSDWIENTGTVPEGVTKYTALEVMYRDGIETIWKVCGTFPNDDPVLWGLCDSVFDVIKYRFL